MLSEGKMNKGRFGNEGCWLGARCRPQVSIFIIDIDYDNYVTSPRAVPSYY